MGLWGKLTAFYRQPLELWGKRDSRSGAAQADRDVALAQAQLGEALANRDVTPARLSALWLWSNVKVTQMCLFRLESQDLKILVIMHYHSA